jgi:hypothetical protein
MSITSDMPRKKVPRDPQNMATASDKSAIIRSRSFARDVCGAASEVGNTATVARRRRIAGPSLSTLSSVPLVAKRPPAALVSRSCSVCIRAARYYDACTPVVLTRQQKVWKSWRGLRQGRGRAAIDGLPYNCAVHCGAQQRWRRARHAMSIPEIILLCKCTPTTIPMRSGGRCSEKSD